jgi:uncharacterized damage-inducible protein DinB
MRLKVSAAFCAMVMVAAASAAQPAGAQKDRAAAVKYLEETRTAFLKSIENVDEAQWKHKSSPTVWSVAEVSEHIALSEETILGLITTQMVKAPAPKPGEGISDEKLIAMITDRTQKAQAPEMLRPVNKWATKEALVKDFNAARDRTIEWVKSTPEDLRAHAAPHPAFGPLDAHQWLLLLAGHSARHTAQIEEVKKTTSAGSSK